ncbi:MAG TPA: beta-galactosidase [Termitinemataceae bacterium]|nr:beta-galactosidase [Termitinemataceae bacterium]HOM23639.1 beta-galactosidase [Termitinemataceae bacterium]
MDNFGMTPQYLTKNGLPWFPIMGEFHYSRYPAEYWKESLLKMKAGGVDIVSSYVIWIHHEEIEGEYDFSGQRNLRRFVETVAECGLYFWIRIGPWCHGEVRNGGFPDWLLQKPFPVRVNNEDYFATVSRFYRAIYEQIRGLQHKDGGPIIGIQIENEYGHCGGLGGEEGERHMQRLTALAREIGFEAPYWSATGWGGAVTGGLIPVMGGYCEAPWDQRLTEIEPSGNYIFTHERNDHNIGSDFGFGHGITFDITKFPYLTAELGGGLQVTRHRRPVARARDIGAMSLVKLGSGVTLLGYYMYHGGTNPRGKLSTLQESRATGFINDLPEYSYDFRAPIREYGQISETYRELKLFTLFLHDFGQDLCTMSAEIPSENPLHPTDYEHLRYSYRHNGQWGYLFVNNYQRRKKMAPHRGVRIPFPRGLSENSVPSRRHPLPQGHENNAPFSGLDDSQGQSFFPPMDIEDGEYFFLPMNMPVGDSVLGTALVSPLCIIPGPRPQWIFYTPFQYAEKLRQAGKIDALYQFKNNRWPTDVEIVTLSREEALRAWKIREQLLFHEGPVIEEGKRVFVFERRPGPALTWKELAGENRDSLHLRGSEAPLQGALRYWRLEVPAWSGDDIFLRIQWVGDVARLYLGGDLVADDFYTGAGHMWEVGLKRFGEGHPLTFILEIEGLSKETPLFLEEWPSFPAEGELCNLIDVTVEIETRRPLSG